MRLTTKLFLEHNDEFVMGAGRIALLKSIKELGSLRKAAEKAGMSYRWAWGRMNKAEEALGVKLLVRSNEAVGGRPMILTGEALELIEWYAKVQEGIQKTLNCMDESMPVFLKNIPEKSRPADAKKKRLPLD